MQGGKSMEDIYDLEEQEQERTGLDALLEYWEWIRTNKI